RSYLGHRQSLSDRRFGLRLQGAQEPDDHHHGAGDAVVRPYRRASAFRRTLGVGDMTTTLPQIVAVDRRTTLKWLLGTMAVGQLAACGDQAKGLSWPEVAAIKAPGIGKDPNLLEPVVPWPLTMTRAELLAAAALSDLILPAEGEAPAPSAVGVPAF